jgi:hypothetical protein
MHLCYVMDKLNEKVVITVVDSGVTCNFMKEEVAKELGLQFEPVMTSFKAMNSRMEKVIGTTKEISLKLGNWSGTISFTIVPVDGFDIVLGQEFLWRGRQCPCIT